MNRKPFSTLAALAVVCLAFAPRPAAAELRAFTALPIEGSQETPAVTTTGSGTFNAIYDDEMNVLRYNYVWALDVGSTSLDMAHFHGPAPAGTPAGVQIGILAAPAGPTGNASGSAALTELQEADLLAGLWYINLHSDQHGGGELRGQLIPSPVTHSQANALMDGAQEVPPVAGSGIGMISTTYDDATNSLTYAYGWTGLTGPVTMAHFHGPAAPGVDAGVQIGLSGFAAAPGGVFAGSVVLNPTQEADLLAGLWYINLHTAANGGGEIRGQLTLAGPTGVSEWVAYE
jgi:hypothetical protein